MHDLIVYRQGRGFFTPVRRVRFPLGPRTYLLWSRKLLSQGSKQSANLCRFTRKWCNGSHACLRGMFRKEWEFESPLSHKLAGIHVMRNTTSVSTNPHAVSSCRQSASPTKRMWLVQVQHGVHEIHSVVGWHSSKVHTRVRFPHLVPEVPSSDAELTLGGHCQVQKMCHTHLAKR